MSFLPDGEIPPPGVPQILPEPPMTEVPQLPVPRSEANNQPAAIVPLADSTLVAESPVMFYSSFDEIDAS